VNAVIPGAVDTPMLRRGARPGKDVPGRTPLRRIGRPQEIAEAVLFLADAARSSFVTGECLVVDGGALARLSTE
jgi:NAD(P)-dependent dehydrogenase (short-subunit alcohol dehydrogenase family)